MRGEQYLTKPQQYALVYNKGSSWASSWLVMKKMANGLPLSRYGFSVSRKVGNAVMRNKLKRWLREILRIMPLKAGHDMVFIVRPVAAAADYWNLKKMVEDLLSRAHLLEIDKEPKVLAKLKTNGDGESGN